METHQILSLICIEPDDIEAIKQDGREANFTFIGYISGHKWSYAYDTGIGKIYLPNGESMPMPTDVAKRLEKEVKAALAQYDEDMEIANSPYDSWAVRDYEYWRSVL